MDIKVSEVDGKLICEKYNHKEPIIMIAMEESIPVQERLLCVKCLQMNRIIVKMLGIDQVLEMIKEKSSQAKQENQQLRSKDLLVLKEFQQKMKNIQTKMVKDFEEILRITQQWINEYEKKEEDTQTMNIIKGLEMLNQKQQPLSEQMSKINQAYYKKQNSIMQRLIKNDINKTYDLLLKQLQIKNEFANQKEQEPDKLIQENDEKLEIIKQIKQIQKIKYPHLCFAIAFNQNGSIMISGGGQDIQVWKMEKGKLTEKKKLSEHSECVTSLVFSKKCNWFASGSFDQTIRCWKEYANGEWISTKPAKQHSFYISCLLLNQKEDELISGSNDKTIKVWEVNCQSNELNYNYALENRHTGWINGISMNECETYLVSCSNDKKIILWNKNKQKKWQFQNEIVNDDDGLRLCFISDYQILWQQSKKGISHFFEIKNGELMRRPELNLQLNQGFDDHAFFPTIFNKTKQIIVQSYSKNVYFLKKYENDQVSIISDPIDCMDKSNYGSLTDDGEYFVVWIQGANEMRVYQIQYK